MNTINTMNEMDVWDAIKGVGELYIEEELVVGNEPVLFVCVSEDRTKRYLVMTYDSCEGVYIYREIDAKSLLQMLHNKRTMHEIFRAAGCLYVTEVCPDTDLLIANEESAASFPDAMLPKKGEYFELNSGHIRKYVSKLEHELTCRNIAYDVSMPHAQTMTVSSLEDGFVSSYNFMDDENLDNFAPLVTGSKVPLSQIAA